MRACALTLAELLALFSAAFNHESEVQFLHDRSIKHELVSPKRIAFRSISSSFPLRVLPRTSKTGSVRMPVAMNHRWRNPRALLPLVVSSQ